MTQTTFASNASPSLPLLDANFTELYELRELISTPGYSSVTQRVVIGNGGAGTFDLMVQKSAEYGRLTVQRGGVGAWNVSANTATNALEFFFNAFAPAVSVSLSSDMVIGGNLTAKLPSAAPSLSVNGQMSFQLVSNTSLKVLARGSDGVTRTVTFTLA